MIFSLLSERIRGGAARVGAAPLNQNQKDPVAGVLSRSDVLFTMPGALLHQRSSSAWGLSARVDCSSVMDPWVGMRGGA